MHIAPCLLTMRDLLVGIKVLVHVHGKIHHVGFAEKVQLALEKLLFIVNLL